MSTITLEDIKTAQKKIAEMIAALEAKQPRVLFVPSQSIELMPGEHYAGIIIGKDIDPDYHLILLPDEAESVTWAKAKEFATEVGGNLPTRREQSLLFANLKEQFQPNWYWSSEQHASDSGYAWMQHFSDGGQLSSHKDSACRARAVRRLPI